MSALYPNGKIGVYSILPALMDEKNIEAWEKGESFEMRVNPLGPKGNCEMSFYNPPPLARKKLPGEQSLKLSGEQS